MPKQNTSTKNVQPLNVWPVLSILLRMASTAVVLFVTFNVITRGKFFVESKESLSLDKSFPEKHITPAVECTSIPSTPHFLTYESAINSKKPLKHNQRVSRDACDVQMNAPTSYTEFTTMNCYHHLFT